MTRAVAGTEHRPEEMEPLILREEGLASVARAVREPAPLMAEFPTIRSDALKAKRLPRFGSAVCLANRIAGLADSRVSKMASDGGRSMVNDARRRALPSIFTRGRKWSTSSTLAVQRVCRLARFGTGEVRRRTNTAGCLGSGGGANTPMASTVAGAGDYGF